MLDSVSEPFLMETSIPSYFWASHPVFRHHRYAVVTGHSSPAALVIQGSLNFSFVVSHRATINNIKLCLSPTTITHAYMSRPLPAAFGLTFIIVVLSAVVVLALNRYNFHLYCPIISIQSSGTSIGDRRGPGQTMAASKVSIGRKM